MNPLYKDKKGAVMPILIVFIAFIAFGLMAVVVDAGMLYAEKKSMVTAADAGALAGAQILAEAGAGHFDDYKQIAEDTAKEIALANGALTVSAIAGPSDKYNRKVITVVCKVTKNNFFARLIPDHEDDTTSDVGAKAVATWGYIKKYTAKNLIPFYIFDSSYKDDRLTQSMLHGQFPSSPPNYGFFDVGINMFDALKGESTVETIDMNLDNVTGNREAIVNAVVTRLEYAEEHFKDDPAEKKQFMTGLVPIIDTSGTDGFYAVNHIVEEDQYDSSKWPSQLTLPVAYFAYYVIEDVIKQNQTTGVSQSLYTSDYKYPAGIGIDYSDSNDTVKLPNGETIKRYYLPEKINEALIIGRFTGKTEPRVSVEDGDQEDPDPNVNGEATYSKLIE